MPVTHPSSIETALTDLAAGRNRNPFAVLGPHRDESSGDIVIRAFQPAAQSMNIRVGSAELRPMTPRQPRGLFEAAVGRDVPDYRLRITYPGNRVVELDDPYRYGRVLTDFDLHLLGEGTHYRAFEKLGAHRIAVGSTVGVHFAVWAPNADRVSVIG